MYILNGRSVHRNTSRYISTAYFSTFLSSHAAFLDSLHDLPAGLFSPSSEEINNINKPERSCVFFSDLESSLEGQVNVPLKNTDLIKIRKRKKERKKRNSEEKFLCVSTCSADVNMSRKHLISDPVFKKKINDCYLFFLY